MPRYSNLPDNPFNDPDPESILGRAVRWPFRVAWVAISLLAFAAYLLFGGRED